MQRLRNRLIGAILLATALPLAATIWITTSLLERSLGFATTKELDHLSRTLEATARQLYQRERETLRREALAGLVAGESFERAAESAWPAAVREFWQSGGTERFALSGTAGDHVEYLRRRRDGVEVYRRDLGGVRMTELSAEFRATRELVQSLQDRDLRRGFTLTLLLLVAVVWMVSLIPLVFMAHRISKPIQALTAGLTEFSRGQWDRRLPSGRSDEVGQAVDAFNRMADQLRDNRDRLVYLTQISSWQTLARKTAHELKNSLTPIRLTVEEMLARQPPADSAFMAEAVQIVVSEIETLERRVRAFSEFSSEPPVRLENLDINALVRERIALLRPGHPDTTYECRLAAENPRVRAAADLVKGVLTNLLENAADAAGPRGCIIVITGVTRQHVAVEVHDSGSGIDEAAHATLFEPTITFKKDGMGLGLSIAKKNALLCGGDLMAVDGELRGAGFRLVLPHAEESTGTVTEWPVNV